MTSAEYGSNSDCDCKASDYTWDEIPYCDVNSFRCCVLRSSSAPCSDSSLSDSGETINGYPICQPTRDQTANLKRACDGQSGTCSYHIDYLAVGDPAAGCKKTYKYAWSCVQDFEYGGASASQTLPDGVGCYQVTSKEECCGFLDGRDPATDPEYGGQPCVWRELGFSPTNEVDPSRQCDVATVVDGEPNECGVARRRLSSEHVGEASAEASGKTIHLDCPLNLPAEGVKVALKGGQHGKFCQSSYSCTGYTWDTIPYCDQDSSKCCVQRNSTETCSTLSIIDDYLCGLEPPSPVSRAKTCPEGVGADVCSRAVTCCEADNTPTAADTCCFEGMSAHCKYFGGGYPATVPFPAAGWSECRCQGGYKFCASDPDETQGWNIAAPCQHYSPGDKTGKCSGESCSSSVHCDGELICGRYDNKPEDRVCCESSGGVTKVLSYPDVTCPAGYRDVTSADECNRVAVSNGTPFHCVPSRASAASAAHTHSQARCRDH